MRGNLDAITDLFKARGPGKILVVTGAGISLASGIPPFVVKILEPSSRRLLGQDGVG
jgi:hypothetical protein